MQVWAEFLNKIEADLGVETTEKWLRPLKVVHFDAWNLYLEAKDSFQALWFEEHIRALLRKRLLNHNSHPIKVHLTVASEAPPAPYSKAKNRGKKAETPPSPPLTFTKTFDPQSTLETFIPGSSNTLLINFLKQLTEKKKTQEAAAFNPLFFYGPPGAGKTHLLMALGQAFQQKGYSVIFTDAETFTEHFVRAIRCGAMGAFRTAYRNADILIVDDVHLIARRAATQEELFHTFNTLHTSGRQIILSSACAPSQLKEIEPRLVSRFEWGIAFPVAKLTAAELKPFLEQRLAFHHFTLQEEVKEFLLATFSSGATALGRALEALILRSHYEKRLPEDVTIPFAEKALSDLIQEEQKAALNSDKILRAVAALYGLRVDDILGKSQSQECALPRQIAMSLCRSELKLPFQKIGAIFARDHSTVMTSVKLIQTKIESQDKEILAILSELKRAIE